MKSLETEHSSQINKISLLEEEGLKKFNNALSESSGSTVIIVHPYDPVPNRKNKDLYENYKKRLKKSVKKYQRLKLPLVIFEQEINIPVLDKILNRMGVNSSDVFVNETTIGCPDPKDMDIILFANKLKANGLKKAVVAGTNFWLWDSNKKTKLGINSNNNLIPLYNKFVFHGCVGRIINTFIEAGIRTTPALAVYPRTLKKIL